jgi:hypothetical protein
LEKGDSPRLIARKNRGKNKETSILYMKLYIPKKKIVREKDISLRHSPVWHPLPEHPGRAGEPGGHGTIIHFLK